MTQQAFADALEVNRGTVVQWERPGAAPPGDLAQAAIDALLAANKQTEPNNSKQSEHPTPTVAAVNVTYSETETLVAVKLLHKEYAEQENERLWGYSVQVVNLVLASIQKAFAGSRPLTTIASTDARDARDVAEAFAATDVIEQEIAARRQAEASATTARSERKAAGVRRR